MRVLKLLLLSTAFALFGNQLCAQTELHYSLQQLKRKLEGSLTKEEYISWQIRISNFYANNKVYSKQNIDTAISYASQALAGTAAESKYKHSYRSALLALAKAKLKNNDTSFVLHKLRPQNTEAQIGLAIEIGKYFLYLPKEEPADLQQASRFLKRAGQLAKATSLTHLRNQAELYLCDVYREKGENVRAKIAFATLIAKSKTDKDLRTAADASSRWGDHLPFTAEKLKYYRAAAQLYDQISDKQANIGMQKAIADVQLNMGQLVAAEAGLLSVLKQYQELGYENLQFTYDLLSVVYRLQGNLKSALSTSLKAIQYADGTESDASMGFFLNNLGSVYAELGNTKESVKAYQRSLEAMQHQNAEARLTSLKMLTDGLIRENHIREVLSLLKVYEKDDQTPLAKVIYATIKGNAYYSLKRYDLAEKYYQQMIFWETKMQSNLFHSAESFYTIAQFYAKRRDFDKSNHYYKKVLDMPSGVTPLSNIRNIYYHLYQADSVRNNLASALQNYRKYKLMDDSLLRARSNHDIQELLIQYQANQKEQENELLRKESILQKNQLQKSVWLTKLTIIGLLALMVIMGLSLYVYRNRQKANKLLLLHQHEIELKNSSLQTLIEKQEKLLTEKEWLIKEIHHRIKNNLQVITSLLNAQSNYLDNEAALKAIRDSQNRIQSISLIHQKLFQSEQVALVNIHSYIVELMKFLCDTFHVNQKISFEFQVPEIEMDVSQAMPLGLIINEAVTNIIKYAFPDHQKGKVMISLSQQSDGYYEFSIEDDGIGLSTDDPTLGSQSLGMTLIHGLGAQLGAEVEISSEKGTKISLRFPVSSEQED